MKWVKGRTIPNDFLICGTQKDSMRIKNGQWPRDPENLTIQLNVQISGLWEIEDLEAVVKRCLYTDGGYMHCIHETLILPVF